MRRPRSRLAGPTPDSPAVSAEPVTVPQHLLTERLETLVRPDLLHTIHAQGRPAGEAHDRLLPLPLLVSLLLSYVLLLPPSFLALLDSLGEGTLPGFAPLAVSRQAFSQRLRAVPHTIFLALLVEATRLLRSSPHRRPWVQPLAPWAAGIYAVDDTTLDALVRKVDWLWCFAKGASETLAGRLGCLVDLSTGKLAEVLYDSDSTANEKTHLRPLLKNLAQGSLIVMDLGYFAFGLFDWMCDQHLVFVLRMRAKTSYQVLNVLAERPLYRDRVVYLGTGDDRCAHPMRLVELCIDGTWWRYVTNDLDPLHLPAEALWALYIERWSIEVMFAAIKKSLGLAKLRSSDINAVLIQLWTTLLLYQVLQDLRLEIATQAGWKAEDVSWTNLMRRIGGYATKPSPKPPLRDWLRERALHEGLRKRGTRIRRLRQLPDDVLADCRATPQGSAEPVPTRRGSQKGARKAEKRAAVKRGSRSRVSPTLVGLSPAKSSAEKPGPKA